MIIEAPAKINIGLKVLYKRDDGYHELETLMQQIGLCDFLSVKEADKIIIDCSGLDIPLQENIIYKAIILLQERFNISRGVNIVLYKNIPVGAGLAGGSADAAAVMLALKKLWQIDISVGELSELGAFVGADVPFCILGGTALVRGIGEKLTALSKMPSLGVVLAKPRRLSLSTAEVFKSFKADDSYKNFSYDTLIKAIGNQDREAILRWIRENHHSNMLEYCVLKNNPIVARLKDSFIDLELTPLMSGSGPSVFAFTSSVKKAKEAAFVLKQKGFSSWASWTV